MVAALCPLLAPTGRPTHLLRCFLLSQWMVRPAVAMYGLIVLAVIEGTTENRNRRRLPLRAPSRTRPKSTQNKRGSGTAWITKRLRVRHCVALLLPQKVLPSFFPEGQALFVNCGKRGNVNGTVSCSNCRTHICSTGADVPVADLETVMFACH